MGKAKFSEEDIPEMQAERRLAKCPTVTSLNQTKKKKKTTTTFGTQDSNRPYNHSVLNFFDNLTMHV